MSATQTLELLAPERDRGPDRAVPIGPGLVLGQRGSEIACFPIQRLGVRARITGPSAAVEVFLTFGNPYPDAVDGTFVFPLSFDAALVQMRVAAGSRQLEAQVQEREKALENFEQMRQSPLVARLLGHERAEVLTVRLGTINPGETVQVSLAYAEMVNLEQGAFRFSFPLLMSGQLAPGTKLDDEVAVAPDSERVLPPGLGQGAQIAFAVHLEGDTLNPGTLACSQPAGLSTGQKGDLTVDYLRQEKLSPRDFVLTYEMGKQQAPKPWLRTGPRHFLLSVFPPVARVPSYPRDLVVLIDGSDNMRGTNMERTFQGVSRLLKKLDESERFAIVCFNRDLAGYRQGIFCPAVEVPQGLQWLASYDPRGRADLKVLLSRVLGLQPEPNRALVVVLIAAGGIGNEPELYNMAMANNKGIRFFPVGIDAGVNRSFFRRLAGSTRGACFLLSPEESLESCVEQLADDTKQPMLSDIQLLDRGLGLQGDSLTPEAPGVVSYNRPLTIMGLKSGNGGLEIQARTPSGTSWSDAAQPGPAANPALHVVWAHRKVTELNDELKLLVGPKSTMLRQMVYNLSTEYRLLTEATCLVVMDTQSRTATIQPDIMPEVWRIEPPEEVSLTPRPSPISPRGEEKEELEERKTLRRGLTVKDDAPGGPKKLMTTPKLEHRSKLQGGIKDSLVGKPMLPDRRKRGETTPEPEPQPAPPPAPSDVRLEQTQETRRVRLQTSSDSVDLPPPPGSHAAATATAVQEPPPAQARPPAADTAPANQPPPPSTTTEEAKSLLKADPEYRQLLMAEMRQLYQTLGASSQGQPDPNLKAHLEQVLNRVLELAPRSTILQEVHKVGNAYYQSLLRGEAQAVPAIQFWIKRFATLF